MEALLVRQANSAPNATAVVDDTRTVTYRELIARADVLVDILEKHSLETEKPVCIIAHPGLSQILAQIAVLRAGGTCVPVDPNAPADRLKGILEDLDTTLVVTSREFNHLASHLTLVPIEAALDAQIDIDKHKEIYVRASRPETHRSHIMFTSGSTGRPKPIQMLSSSILHVVKYLPTGPLNSSDRMSTMLNSGFDLSLLEVWNPLLEGATIVRVPTIIRNDPFTLLDFVKRQGITIMIIPTALFEVIALTAPAAFRGVRHVIVGGEAVSCSAMRNVLEVFPPENLWNGYGPAEATICATMAHIDHQDVQQSRISIGQPFGNTEVYLLDGGLEPIDEPGSTGEICIAGPQVSPGYLNRPEENKTRFIWVDLATPDASANTRKRLYRTGDLAQWRDKAGGPLDYIGRADDQIKISGYRVELGEVSRMIEEHPHVHSCVVNYHQEKEVKYLEAYVIPVDGVDLATEGLIAWTKMKLPPYMIPRKIFKERTFPLTLNGKVDREALAWTNGAHNSTKPPHIDGKTNGTIYGHTNGKTPYETNGDTEDLTTWLTSILWPMLPSWNGDLSADFFSLGLSSLQAAQFIGRIRRDKGKTITLRQLYSHPTTRSLAEFLTDPPAEADPDPLGIERWKHDLQSLDDPTSVPDWQDADEGRVFLTGATGFLGAHILQKLLCLPTVKQVACLARGQSGLSPSARIQQALEKYKLWDSRPEKTEKILVLEGDLADDTLGLGEKQFSWLTNWASVIFHVGARVNWCEPYEAHYAPNVVGMKNIIRAATLGRRKTVQYVSSIDVWSVTGFINNVDQIYEDEPLMPHMNAAPYDTGYSASQLVAEELLQRARARGLPATIYRPGFIVGHSENAIPNANDYFSRLIMGSIQIGCFPDLATQYLEYVTVDYVTSAIMHIASDMSNLGRAFHIVPPTRSQSVNYDQIHHMLQNLGYPVEKIHYQDWVSKVRESPGTALEAMMPLLEEPVYGDMTRLETSMNTPIYNPANTRIALQSRPDIKYTALDSKLLQQFIKNWVSRGEFTLK